MPTRPRRTPRWMIGPGIALVLLAGAILALRAWVGSDGFRERIAAQLSQVTGRAVSFGAVEPLLSLSPGVAVQQLDVANAPWGHAPQLLHIGRLDVQLALWPLLSGEVRIRRLEITDAQLSLERDADARGNWMLTEGGAGPGDGSTGGGMPRIERVDITGLRLSWRARPAAEPVEIALGELRLRGLGADAPMTIDARSADTGTSLRPWSLRAGVDLAGETQRLSDLAVSYGDSDIAGHLTVSQEDAGTRIDGELTSTRLRIADLTAPAAATDPAPSPKLFSATPLDLQLPPSLHAEVSLAVAELAAGRTTLRDLAGKLRVDKGVLALDGLQAHLDGAPLSTDVSLDTAQVPPRLKLDLTAHGVAIGGLLQQLGGARWIDASGDLDVHVEGRGDTPAAIMASLDGRTRLLIGQGFADLQDADALVGGLGTALGTLVEEGSQRAPLNCVASSFEVRRGVAISQVLLADTEHATVYGSGDIDLRSERLNLVLKPKPKSPTLNVAVPVEVGGTLAAPTFTPEKLSVARKGAGLLAAVGLISFPPAILLGLGELGTGEQNPCLDIAAGKVGGRGTSPDASVGDKVESTLQGIGKSIKGLFD